MELENQKPLRPKTKKAALNQAVQCQLTIDRNNNRKEHLMKHQTEISNKIQKLQEELIRIENTIKNLDVDSETYQSRLSQLQTEFEITELEISEVKIQSLKRNIERQQALLQAGLKPQTSTFLD